MTEMLETHGVKIPLDPGVITSKIERAIRKGRYELDEVSGTPKFLEKDDRVIELGAGIGFISSFLGVNLGVENVLCVEADPTLCAFIQSVHELNGLQSAQVRNCVALNDAAAEAPVSFYVREQFWSSSLDGEEPYLKAIEVPGIRLSNLIRDFKANTLIVDIEGGERDLFAPADLSGIDKIFLEIHTRKIKRIGIKQCFDALSQSGFCYDQQVSRGGSVLFRRIPKWQLKKYAG
ncbi:methyltransferase, FkbM family protein [Rhodobacterales bacterium Y4I]|nr:methyltransferase, FkbM family protein [Rhodobacterales bacterium Y4I]